MQNGNLQEVVKLCVENGGVFWRSGVNKPTKYTTDGDNIFDSDGTHNEFILSPDDFDAVWIYEPPQKSAFQEWDSENRLELKHDKMISPTELRKEGWNALADHILKIKQITYQEIEQLKEP